MQEATLTIVESEQMPNTPSENIKHFEVDGNNVRAVFWNSTDAASYIKKYSIMKYNPKWHDTVGFANFTLKGNVINAHSTYHTTHSLIRMFENGLKNL